MLASNDTAWSILSIRIICAYLESSTDQLNYSYNKTQQTTRSILQDKAIEQSRIILRPILRGHVFSQVPMTDMHNDKNPIVYTQSDQDINYRE